MVDLTNLTNSSTLQQLAYNTNNSVGGILFIGGIVAFYIIILMSLYRNSESLGYDFISVFTVGSWIMFVGSGFFWYADLIPVLLPLMFLFFSAFGTIYLYASK